VIETDKLSEKVAGKLENVYFCRVHIGYEIHFCFFRLSCYTSYVKDYAIHFRNFDVKYFQNFLTFAILRSRMIFFSENTTIKRKLNVMFC
jgi:hypothetical protein